jgi:hypothetical protein
MEIVPPSNEAQRVPGKVTLDLAIEVELYRVRTEVGVEVRRRMMTVEHPDHDSREAAEFGHGRLPVRHARRPSDAYCGYRESAVRRRGSRDPVQDVLHDRPFTGSSHDAIGVLGIAPRTGTGAAAYFGESQFAGWACYSDQITL